VFEVAKFVEKPAVEIAKQYIADGFLWNSGMFVFKASAFMQLFEQHQSEMAQQLSLMTAESFAEIYANFTNISMDVSLASKLGWQATTEIDNGLALAYKSYLKI